ncbi:unnamed protein product, partial [Ixodes pacificus]
MAAAESGVASSRVVFSREATRTFLAILSELNVAELLDSRRQRNQAVFRRVEEAMERLGFHWTWQQLRTHWKNLEGKCNKVDAQNKSGAAPSAWPWYEEMSALLAHHPMSQAREYGVDSEADEDWDGIAVVRNSVPKFMSLGDCLASTDASSSGPQPKRPGRGKNTDLVQLLAKQQRHSAELLKENSELLFQQQKELLEIEKNNIQEIMTGITTSFMQGTQAMMSQLLTQ